jgi:hypothetical protein
MKRVAGMAILLLAGCAKQPTTTTTIATHREKARSILEVHCGLCHLPVEIGGGTGMALHIYDLSKPNWSETLRDEQLPILEQKLHDDGADAAEMKIMHDFVLDELAWRSTHPSL